MRRHSLSHHNRPLRAVVNGRQARQQIRPAAAHRRRGITERKECGTFTAPEVWHEPTGRTEIAYRVCPPGKGYIHPVTVEEVRARVAELSPRWTRAVEVVQFSAMTRKRLLFPLYGMQWGPNIYLYPIEESLVETYVRPPQPQQQIEARMYGGRWQRDGDVWRLIWTPESIRDFYLNNVLIHEIGHANDERNSRFDDRERFANWFAIEYGYRPSRGRC